MTNYVGKYIDKEGDFLTIISHNNKYETNWSSWGTDEFVTTTIHTIEQQLAMHRCVLYKPFTIYNETINR